MTARSANAYWRSRVLDGEAAERVELLTARARAETAARGCAYSEAQDISPISERVPLGAWIGLIWIVLLGALRVWRTIR